MHFMQCPWYDLTNILPGRTEQLKSNLLFYFPRKVSKCIFLKTFYSVDKSMKRELCHRLITYRVEIWGIVIMFYAL